MNADENEYRLILLGDLNGRIDKVRDDVTESFGVPGKNDVPNFCTKKTLCIVNTFFLHMNIQLSWPEE